MINYDLIRSKRKTLSIHITKNATVEVRAPLKMAKHKIDEIALSKKDWIIAHLNAQIQALGYKAEFSLTYNNRVQYKGKEYLIDGRDGNTVGFDGESFYLPSNLDSAQIKESLIQIYKVLAKHDISLIVEKYSRIMDAYPSAVKINSAKTRWGSCSSKGSLNFSWRLIMADTALIDYVVVHELAHLTELNHSGKFWAIVEATMPDYKSRQAKLKAFQKLLATQDWD